MDLTPRTKCNLGVHRPWRCAFSRAFFESMNACNEIVSMSLQQTLNRVIPEEKQEPASS